MFKAVIKGAAKERKKLNLLLLANRNHLSRGDLRSLIRFLESEDCGFDVTLQFSDPKEQPELLELHRLVAIPALIKLKPDPKQIFDLDSSNRYISKSRRFYK